MSTEQIPIFPLSNVVLFPGVLTPLHLFEERYRQLAREALAGARRIGMVVVPPEHTAAMAGNPPLYPVGCAGVIAQDQRLPDGRYNLVLRGEWRFRIVSELPAEPGRAYRVAEVEPLEDPLPESAREHIDELRRLVDAQVRTLVLRAQPERAKQAGEELLADVDPATFVNSLSNALAFSPSEKQGLLEADSIAQRLERLEGLLAFRLAELGRPSGSSQKLH